jgi:hypothetical protein
VLLGSDTKEGTHVRRRSPHVAPLSVIQRTDDHDARGKVVTALSGSDRIAAPYSADSAAMVYDGFGGLVSSSRDRGNRTADEYTLDALGKSLKHVQNRDQGPHQAPHAPHTNKIAFHSTRGHTSSIRNTARSPDSEGSARARSRRAFSYSPHDRAQARSTDQFIGWSLPRPYLRAGPEIRCRLILR